MTTAQSATLLQMAGHLFSHTATFLEEEDRELLASKGVQVVRGDGEQTWTCTFPEGTRTLPPKNTELFNQDGTRVVGMFLERYYVLDGDILVLVVTWFAYPDEGPRQEWETRISVLGADHPGSSGAPQGKEGAET